MDCKDGGTDKVAYTRERISKRAAPSLRSDSATTGLARSNAAKKEKKAAVSFR